jgi:hypothetical protein
VIVEAVSKVFTAKAQRVYAKIAKDIIDVIQKIASFA